MRQSVMFLFVVVLIILNSLNTFGTSEPPLIFSDNETIPHFVIRLFKTYHKAYRPNGNIDNETTSEPVVVNVDIEVSSFGELSAVDMEFSLSIFLHQSWVDPRLRYSEFQNCIHLNYMRDELWVPDLYFPNAVSSNLHQVTTPNYLIWLFPNGTINYSQKISLRTSCVMDLYNFPLDKQSCDLSMASFSYSSQDVIFKWAHGTNHAANAVCKNSSSLNEFNVNNITTNAYIRETSRFGNFSCIFVTFLLQRQSGFYMIYAYFPSLLIVLITWLSFLIDFTSAPARISLGLLSMLTLITQGTAIVQRLPKVSYIKAIESWMFTCLAFVVVSLLEFVFINSFCRDGHKTLISFANSIRRASQPEHVIKARMKKHSQSTDDPDSVPKRYGFLSKITTYPKKVGYFIDGVFFVMYPLAFGLFNIIYWTYFISYN